ncbi:hypothetical protein Vqi01_30010 [Micromonospora qiuiae]|uniref:ABC transporter domain-containing protein n=1 Tax=Micromonospora qiuiae TaxID=502268 RepID=A0ABQ4JCE2_9ACTN|nr:hypothetical protein Vqi01_30010 [Micromonospora qiuiae]
MVATAGAGAPTAAGPPAGGQVTLDVRDLRMRYGTNDVLDGVSFTARRGEVLALLGPNGAGKTTTIEILEGFRMRSGGQVDVLGVDPAHGDERWRARLGVVLQSWRDHSRWRVRELLAHLGSFYAPYSTNQIHRPWDADELIEAVGLTAHAGKKVGQLSGGQRRRVDVAVGIVDSWRHLETLLVLGGWAVLGLALASVLLRRMARRESGSNVAARREKALQRVT